MAYHDSSNKADSILKLPSHRHVYAKNHLLTTPTWYKNNRAHDQNLVGAVVDPEN